MRNLKEIYFHGLLLSKNSALRRPLDISRKKQCFSAISQAQDEGIIVLRGLAFGKIVRPQDRSRHVVFRKRIALFQMPDEHTVCSSGRKDLAVSATLNVAPHPEFTDAKIFKNGRKSSKMIFVRMREGDNVDFFQPARPQIRRNDILANVNTGAHASRMEISEFAAPIDQHGATAREGKK